jgi:Lar family restriction alleviation protein
MSDDLKPCPFCGEAQPPHDDTSWVRCLGCGAETGWRPTGDEAIAAWNTRTPDPRIEALTAENERLRRTIGAAGKLGRIIGFLGDDEERIAAFLEACGPDLVNRARAALAEIEGEKP